jgi:hypothetical protein
MKRGGAHRSKRLAARENILPHKEEHRKLNNLFSTYRPADPSDFVGHKSNETSQSYKICSQVNTLCKIITLFQYLITKWFEI